MNSRSSLIIVLSIGAALGILFLVLFEPKDVPDYNLDKKYNYKSKEPYGTWVFEQLVKSKYPDVPFYYNQLDTHYYDLEGNKHLYIKFGDRLKIDATELGYLEDWISRGNKAILISTTLELEDRITSSASFDRFRVPDSMLTLSHRQSILEHKYSFDSLYSTFGDAKDFLHKESQLYYPDSILSTMVLMDHTVCLDQRVGSGNFIHHSMPILFSNIAKDCEGFLPHFAALIQQEDIDAVILDHQLFDKVYSKHRKPGTTGYGKGRKIDGDSFLTDTHELHESKLQYILESKSLKWAYYLFLLFILIYVWFNSKRKQAIIPVLAKKQNTTIEYVETIASMYEKQAQHTKLILKMKEIFYNRIKESYYLDQNEPGFKEKLTKKSKVPEEELDRILRDFSFAEKGDVFTQMQLAGTYERIENFYKKMA